MFMEVIMEAFWILKLLNIIFPQKWKDMNEYTGEKALIISGSRTSSQMGVFRTGSEIGRWIL